MESEEDFRPFVRDFLRRRSATSPCAANGGDEVGASRSTSTTAALPSSVHGSGAQSSVQKRPWNYGRAAKNVNNNNSHSVLPNKKGTARAGPASSAVASSAASMADGMDASAVDTSLSRQSTTGSVRAQQRQLPPRAVNLRSATNVLSKQQQQQHPANADPPNGSHMGPESLSYPNSVADSEVVPAVRRSVVAVGQCSIPHSHLSPQYLRKHNDDISRRSL